MSYTNVMPWGGIKKYHARTPKFNGNYDLDKPPTKLRVVEDQILR